jgi:NADP-dependent 3-hydroxy acid dehydrogenase YdfG
VTKRHEDEPVAAAALAVALAAALAADRAQLVAVDNRLAELEAAAIKLREDKLAVALQIADATNSSSSSSNCRVSSGHYESS